MKRIFRTALICAVILQIFATASHSVSHAFKRTVVGQEIDGFLLETLDGEEVELYPSLGTKATLMVFWASWSPRSAEILKDAQRLLEEHGPTELKVIAVNVEHPEWNPVEAEHIRSVGTDAGATYPMVLDKDLEVFNHYGVVAVPSSMVLDKDGKVLQMLSGYASMTKDDLKDGVLKALGKYVDPAVANKVDPTIYKPKGKAARHYNMAKRLVMKKRHKRALKPATQAIKEDPDYADAYRILAQIHEKMGNADKAAEAIKKADELDSARGIEPKEAVAGKVKEQSAAAKMLAEKMGTKSDAAPAAEVAPSKNVATAKATAEATAKTTAETTAETAADKTADDAAVEDKAAPATSGEAKSE